MLVLQFQPSLRLMFLHVSFDARTCTTLSNLSSSRHEHITLIWINLGHRSLCIGPVVRYQVHLHCTGGSWRNGWGCFCYYDSQLNVSEMGSTMVYPPNSNVDRENRNIDENSGSILILDNDDQHWLLYGGVRGTRYPMAAKFLKST